jgi:hypothetical protein
MIHHEETASCFAFHHGSVNLSVTPNIRPKITLSLFIINANQLHPSRL